MQQPFIPDVQLVDNTSQRLPLVLVLDGSGSMAGQAVAELNAGLKTLETALKDDETASQRVQLMILRAHGADEVEIVTQWTDAMNFSAPKVEAHGRTPLGKAMALALKAIEDRKETYRTAGIPYNRPWIYVISDGKPNDAGWEVTAEACRSAISSGKVLVFPIGVRDADTAKLGQFSDRGAAMLDGLRFQELFLWLSRSVSAASKAGPGETLQLPAPDWMKPVAT